MSRGSAIAVALLTALYLLLAGEAVLDDRFLHDEGLLTQLLAALVGREPAATLFLQKARPPLALLYAPVASGDLSTFLWAHVLVAAIAVPLVGLTAARLGQPRPELAAAVVALSPMHVAAGAGGLMNADAVVGVALVAWLWARERPLAAGVVAGVLVWVRAELAVLALVLAVWALWRRRGRMLVGLASFPVVYGIAGALYHGDLLWMLHFPPALAQPMEGNPYWEGHHADASLAAVVSALLAVSPAIGLVALWRRRGTSSAEQAGLLAMGLLVAALTVLPRWQVFNFDLSPRYLLPVLPFVALAVGRVLADLGPDDAAIGARRRGLALGGLAVVATIVARTGGGPAAAIAVLLSSLAAALGGAGRERVGLAIVAVLVALGPPGFGDGARLRRTQQAAPLEEAVMRLREHPEWEGRPIYTNEPLLAAYLARSGALPGREVHYLVQADQLHELTSLANPGNGQRTALLAALREGFYGRPVFPDEVRPDALPRDAIFVLREDPRLELVLPSSIWSSWLREVHPGAGMSIATRVDAPEDP